MIGPLLLMVSVIPHLVLPIPLVVVVVAVPVVVVVKLLPLSPPKQEGMLLVVLVV